MITTEVGQRLRQIRKDSGLSQEQFAQALGVTRQAVSKWESGQSLPDLENIVLICERFGVSADYILRGREKNRETPPKASRRLPIYAAALLLAGAVLFCLLPFLARRLQISDMELFGTFHTYASAYIFAFPLAGLLILAIAFTAAGAAVGVYALLRRRKNQ